MGFTNASSNAFPPATLQPLYRIWRDWCIGDSLGYMNDNFLYLETLSNSLSSKFNTIPRTYNFWYTVSLTRVNDTWSSNGSDGSGLLYTIPSSSTAYSFKTSTPNANDTITGTETLQDTNIIAPYNCDLFLNYRGYWNQNGVNSYLTSPVLITVSYEYSTDNGATWIRPNGYVFTYGVAGASLGTNPYYLANYQPVQNAGGATIGSVKTTLLQGQTIKIRPDWRVYPLNTEQNTTRVSSIGSHGVFEIVLQPTTLTFA